MREGKGTEENFVAVATEWELTVLGSERGSFPADSGGQEGRSALPSPLHNHGAVGRCSAAVRGCPGSPQASGSH